MASSRAARFAMEAAPQKLVGVLRHRVTVVLDTIQEEEMEPQSPKIPHGSPPASSSNHFLQGIKSGFSTRKNYLGETGTLWSCLEGGKASSRNLRAGDDEYRSMYHSFFHE
ncbi:hypothetical protein Droror1_Dr00026214 [Drosera rotundifolia]